MPLTPFLKMFGRLLVVALLILALCTGLFAGLNAVRKQGWTENFATPFMDWVASAPEPLANHSWLGSVYDLDLVSPDTIELTDIESERLNYGQVVATEHGLGVRLRRLKGKDTVIDVTFRDLYRDVSEASALIVLTRLNDTVPSDRTRVMATLGKKLHVHIEPVTEVSETPDEATLDRLVKRGLVFYQMDRNSSAQLYLRLQGGSVIRIDMPAPFNLWAWPVVLLVFALAAGIAGFFLFLLLRDVDRSMRIVESVAVRIARGEMEARVDTGNNMMVRRLSKSFNSMAEHIQRLVDVQREMIHAVSHELRTPVARIRFGVQMIESCQDEKALHKQLSGIDDDIQELDELIDEILTYARLEQGGPIMTFQESSVVGIVEQIVEEQQCLRPDIRFRAVFTEDCPRWAQSEIEPRYIHRALQNLVGNGGRYAKSEVRVRCQLDEQTCRIDVEDDGPGIPDGEWEKVFTAFARLDDSRTRTSGGYGLGLSIVRRILYWHGGQAFVTRSTELGGAAFSLVWPRRQ